MYLDPTGKTSRTGAGIIEFHPLGWKKSVDNDVAFLAFVFRVARVDDEAGDSSSLSIKGTDRSHGVFELQVKKFCVRSCRT